MIRSEPQSNQWIKTLWVREPYLSQILAGRKTVEVRIGYDNIRRLQPGDQLKLNDQHLVTIRRVTHYADFEGLVAQEDTAAIAPDLSGSPGQAMPDGELLDSLRQIYPPEKEALGAVALEVVLPRPYDAVLFDMGYTLVYWDPPVPVLIRRALRSVGVERTADEIGEAVESVWGDYYRDAATATFPGTEEHDAETQTRLGTALLAQLGVEGASNALPAYHDALEEWFNHPGVMRSYPEVGEVLTTLRERGYRLGIVSNWSWNLRQRVAQVDLHGHFELIWASAYAGCNKPHPGIFHQALAQMDLSPERTIYVGDSYRHDVVGARHAGLDVALVNRDGSADNADCPVIQDLRGIFTLLGE